MFCFFFRVSSVYASATNFANCNNNGNSNNNNASNSNGVRPISLPYTMCRLRADIRLRKGELCPSARKMIILIHPDTSVGVRNEVNDK